MLIVPEALSPSSQQFWIRLGAALLCGIAVGIERQARGKVAGVRTSALICLGTSVFVALGVTIAPERADPTRVIGQVVTGIGFLGAGVILTREGKILGVTTAAVIWVLAAIGCLIGVGMVWPAIVITLVTIVVLIGVEIVEEMVERRRGHRISRELEGINIE